MVRSVDSCVGKRLRQRRAVLGLSQGALAKSLGVTFQQVQNTRKAPIACPPDASFNVRKSCGCRWDYFFEDLEPWDSGRDTPATDADSLEFIEVFKRLGDRRQRKAVADLVRAIGR